MLSIAAGVGLGIAFGLNSPGKGRWVIHDLGTLPGLSTCQPIAIDNGGRIVGSCWTEAGQSRGFVWQNGKMIDLGSGMSPAAINDRGQVVGTGSKGAFLWQRGKLTWLDPMTRSNATAISEHGQIAGVTWSRTAPGEAVLWQGGKIVDLGTTGEPAAVNGQGQIVGVRAGRDPHAGDAFLWRSGKVTDLGLFSLSSESIAINDSGQVVASGAQGAFEWQNGRFSSFGGDVSDALAINASGKVLLEDEKGSDKRGDAYFWHDGTLTKLPSFDDDTQGTFASALNDPGQIVGDSIVEIGSKRAFVWQNGKMTELPTLTPKGQEPWDFATAINDNGQIIGTSNGVPVLWARS